jgi:hypothetical protein
MRRLVVALAAAVLASLPGCAAVTCTPAVIVVAENAERPRLQTEPRGLRTDQLGRVKEQRREVIVSEYWVRDPNGRWYPVAGPAWRAVEPGQSLQVCRQARPPLLRVNASVRLLTSSVLHLSPCDTRRVRKRVTTPGFGSGSSVAPGARTGYFRTKGDL